ncbi:MAG: hypothetical protein JWL81_1044 [Verrucomicrobiales bacterium]|nr:hypothetical protein [Verrucomicrobiales bacterium]
MTDVPSGTPISTNYLIRIPEVFAPWTPEILAACRIPGGPSARSVTPLGPEYSLLKMPALPSPEAPAAAPDPITGTAAAPFISWHLPIHHSWPCHPPKMENFIEKAARTLHRKFAAANPQSIQIGPLHAGAPDRYYKSLASNLRGRTLQLFPARQGPQSAEEQNPNLPTLFCLVGKEGLFAGLQTPRLANGFHPGGTKFVSQGAAGTISRAGAKIAEALHYLLLHRPALPEGSHWLELGASPGGMTSELLNRHFRVTALDRAALDPRLNKAPGLTFAKADVATWTPPPATRYDALLCDMNGEPRQALRQVIRLASFLRPGALLVFTLKTPGASTFQAISEAIRLTLRDASQANLTLIALTHLTYNRQEFTCFFET